MFGSRFSIAKSGLLAAGLLSAALVWALPSPKEIEQAEQAGQFSQAESMLREVLADKPQSAKAHYDLGVLLERQKRYLEAQTELRQAKTLDPSLKFTRDPQNFEDQLAHVNERVQQNDQSLRHASPAVSTGVVQHADTSAMNAGVSPLTLVWVAIAGLLIVALIVRRRAPDPVVVEVPARPQGFGAQFTPGGVAPGYSAGYGPAYPPAGSGSGVAGAVVGGVAGLAAGYALAKAMEGDHTSAAATDVTAAHNNGYVPIDNPSGYDSGQVDDMARFEPSAGDSWDNASNDTADSGGDDSAW